ncbi:hypothetical protein LLG90_10255 [Aromatoleum toluclasticum]|nr:hypothetical protein [Aromatoleum toluclasticum]
MLIEMPVMLLVVLVVNASTGGTTRAGPWPMPPRGARPSRLRSGQLSDVNGMAIIVDLA